MTSYEYTKTPVNIDRLEQEIEDSAIGSAPDFTTIKGSEVTVCFPSELSTGDEATLTAVVANHTAPSSKPGETALVLKDGVGTPAVLTDGAQLFVDVADGNLKVVFGNGTVKTIMTNP